MFKLKLSLLYLLLSFKSCLPLRLADFDVDISKNVSEDFFPRVVNGWAAKVGEVAYQISFKNLISRPRNIYASFCGGVLVTPSKLITAAHCFEEEGFKCFGEGEVSEKTLDRTFAVAGNLFNLAKYNPRDSPINGQWRRLRSMYIPLTYRFPKDDIAVGFTKRSFTIDGNVSPIPYTTVHRNYRGKCLVSGFGRISETAVSDILLLAHLELIPAKDCDKKHRRKMRKFVCTDTYMSDVGKGDSGGPLVCSQTGDPQEVKQGILVGIVSGNRIGVGSFFTRVSSYTHFLNRAERIVYKPNKSLICLCLLYVNNVRPLFCFIW